MLDILYSIKDEMDFKINVAHVNHLLRGDDANKDEKFVEEYCKKKQIKYFIKRIDVKKYANNNKIGTEEAGRNLRYNFFEEVMNLTNSNKIAIAHNKNDKIETIIMNIIRGTGIAGLKGIEPKRDNKIIRPLIECERREIEQYASENNLLPRIDNTNFENEYTRNKVRNIVIPYIEKEFNSNIIETVYRLSEVATETDKYIQIKTEEIFNDLILEENDEKIILNLKEFNKQDIFMRKTVLMYVIKKVLGNVQNIEKINIEDLIKLCEKNVGNKYLKPNKYIKVLINKGKIFVIKM